MAAAAPDPGRLVVFPFIYEHSTAALTQLFRQHGLRNDLGPHDFPYLIPSQQIATKGRQMPVPTEGDLAPDFDLPDEAGGRVVLSALRGRIVVLYFYPRDDTAGCTREAIDFSEHLPQFEAAGATVIGVSADSAQSHARFKAKHGLSIRLAADEQHETVERYGLWVEKSMYGRRFMGIERATFIIGPDGRIKRIWRNVRVPGHIEEVLEAVREI